MGYCKLVGIRDTHVPVPQIKPSDPNFSVLQQMWYWLEYAAECDWVCPVLLQTAMDAEKTGSWTHSETVKRVLRKRSEDLAREISSRMDAHSVRCSRRGCVNRLASAGQLKRCGRCKAVSCCSIGCQQVDWRAGHKTVCKPANHPPPAPATVSAAPSGKAMATIGGITFASETLTADDFNNVANLLREKGDKLLRVIRGQTERPPLEYNELMRQARELMHRHEYSSAVRCLTRAADDLLDSKAVFGGDKEERGILLEIVLLRIKCTLALAEKRLSETDVDSALENWSMETTAKLLKTRLSYTLPVQAQSNQPGRRNKNGKSKSKKKQHSKRDEPSLIVSPTEKLIGLQVAKNAVSADDGCTICLTAWNEFTTLTLAAIPPCKHATCAPCLARFHKACQKSFATDTSTERTKTAFACVLCRAPLPDSLVTSMANVSILRNLVPAFQDLPHHLGMSDGEDQRRLLTSLLTAHDFDLAHITNILSTWWHRIYEAAREPVRKLAAEHHQLRTKLAASYESDHPEWKATVARARAVSEALEVARANAAADIYERMNATGKMGAADNKGAVHVDLHGLHKEEARTIVVDFVLPTLPVLKTVHVITGKGAHSEDGEGVLRDMVKGLAAEHGVRVEKTKNSGVMCLKM
ncbi:hypothetical protein HDU86_001855 [Geranomyces michiganensis]|nr:hypothetical protein HDU86_001855 [Geranomyces michiganensis]